MPFEIDFLPVGDASKSGDAIAIRYGNLSGPRSEQMVVTIDGGTRASGDALAQHVVQAFGTTTVDIAILTHPDMDHASGMRSVLESLKVTQVVMHRPWEHSRDVLKLVDDNRVTTGSLESRSIKNLKAAREVEKLAKANGSQIVEPFAGSATSGGEITVLGPTVDFYQNRLANFRFMPGADGQSRTRTASYQSQSSALIERETWAVERLSEPHENASSAENNSSTVLLLNLDGKSILLTGDAGVPALHAALDFAEINSLIENPIRLFQVPHHGSRKNLSSSVLNRLFGRPHLSDHLEWHAVVSAAPKAHPKHPNKKITNALQRRGAAVSATGNGKLLFSHGVKLRNGYGPLDHIPFYNVVESDSLTE